MLLLKISGALHNETKLPSVLSYAKSSKFLHKGASEISRLFMKCPLKLWNRFGFFGQTNFSEKLVGEMNYVSIDYLYAFNFNSAIKTSVTERDLFRWIETEIE